MSVLGHRHPPAPPRAEPAAAGPVHERSAALATACGHYGDGRKRFVLDLGAAVPATIQFLSRFRCRLHVADLAAGMAPPAVATAPARPRKTGASESAGAAAAFALPPAAADDPLDLILAWDLLNYLPRPAITALAQQLRPACKDGTRLHAVIWSRREMPPAPLRFLVVDASHFAHAPLPEGRIPSPALMEPELRRLLPGFAVESSLLLRNGMQEYLFAWEG